MNAFKATHYQPYYCEENIWWLIQHPALTEYPKIAVLITNPSKTVALAHQRAGGDDGVVVWDYHVVLAVRQSSWLIYDLDTTLGCPSLLTDWVENSFNGFYDLPDHYRPQFRCVPGLEYQSRFASDRRHMRNHNGSWTQPTPPWSAIGTGHTLDQLIDSKDHTFGPFSPIIAFKNRLDELSLS